MKTAMPSRDHWENVYSTKSTDGVSWYQPHAEHSLRLIEAAALPRGAAIIDVGGGASKLVDDLLAQGRYDLTVLDLSTSALAAARARLGAAADAVTWRVADITKAGLPAQAYDLWHDRAVFHFLTAPSDRRVYVQAVRDALKPGGHVIIATFAEDGPLQCSGLPVMRYGPLQLQAEFGVGFSLVSHEREQHATPFGSTQAFTYCHFLMP